jgi:LemA protein
MISWLALGGGAVVAIAVGGVGIVFVGWFIVAYNGLVAGRNRYQNAFSQIDVQLKRRYDLIPNLVEIAKKYMAHERETLEAVIAARNQAAEAEGRAAARPGDPSAMKAMVGAEGALKGTLGRLFALVESYPDLKANQNMLSLQEELSSTENKVAFARQAFNDAVTSYNIRRESFPDMIVAGLARFEAAELFQVASEVEREAPKVKF